MMSEELQPEWPPPLRTRITDLFGVRYPIIQAGMVWTAGNKLAVAVSEAGALGLIGSGSMRPDLLRAHIHEAQQRTSAPVGVNIPLSRSDAADLVRVTIEEGIRIVFTSSGNPSVFSPSLKKAGCTVVHVVASARHARKAYQSGCDAVVAEGFEAGGHNGVDEITTFTLVPQIVDAVPIPVLAAGGIADGRGFAAALCLGADGVQVGTRFAATVESSAHDNYKRAIVEAEDAGTVLTLKKVTPVRLLKTPFALRAVQAELQGASREELQMLLGEKRERLGIFEGNRDEGEFEAGQCSGLIHDIPPAREIVQRMMREYYTIRMKLP
jgi:enoyl-[acyl-carrier protein] reductase II